MNKIKLLILAAITVVGVGLAISPTTYAACTDAKSCITSGVDSAGGTGSSTDVGTIIKTIVNILLFILGAVSVIMIIIGGMKYTLSQGDSSSLTSAKNTILYSVIGLIVAVLAFGIVNFVLTQFVSTPVEETKTDKEK